MTDGFSIAWKIKLPDPEKCTALQRDFLIAIGKKCYEESKRQAQQNHSDSRGRTLPPYSDAYARRRQAAGKSVYPDFTWSGRAWSIASQNISIFSRRLDIARLRNSFRGSWMMPKTLAGGKAAKVEAAQAARDLRASLGRNLTASEWFGIKRQYMAKKTPSARAKAWFYASRHPDVYLLGYAPELVRSILTQWRADFVNRGNNGAKVVL
jgi:hypothetical protein